MMWTPEASMLFRQHLNKAGLTEKSMKKYACVADRLMLLNDEESLRRMSTEEMVRSICKADVAPKTTENYEYCVRAFQQYLREVRA